MSHERMKEITEPSLPDPKVHLALPDLKILQSIVLSMKNVGNFIIMQYVSLTFQTRHLGGIFLFTHFRADLGGSLTLTVETETVQMSSFFRDLEIPMIGFWKHFKMFFLF
jgi:hypothetical protein